MSSISYHLESFRPWKPSQEKEQPLRDRIGIFQYPSPVSISTTPSPSNLSNSVSQRLGLYAPGSEQHPLPVRPPAEVCFNGDSQLNAQITRHEPEILEPPSTMNPNREAFDFEDSLYPDDPPNPGDDDSAITLEQIVPDFEHQHLDFDSSGQDLVFTPDQHSQYGFLESSMETGDFPESPTIDPAILDDNNCRDVEPPKTTGSTPAAAALPRKVPVEHSRPLARDTLCHNRQQTPKSPVKTGRLPAKISKVSVVIENCPKNRARRPIPELGSKNVSFPNLRAQFSALPVEDRLQFLSWLFEGALSHCLHPSLRSDKVTTSRSQHAGERVKVADKGGTPSRKGLSWSEEEADLLVKLKEEENLSWSEVTERFGKQFPGRSQGSLQVYWSTKLGKRQSSPAKNV